MPDDPSPQPAPSPAPAPVPPPLGIGALLGQLAAKSPKLAFFAAALALGVDIYVHHSPAKPAPVVTPVTPRPECPPQPEPLPPAPPFEPRPAPAPVTPPQPAQPPLVLVAKEYGRTFASTFADVAGRIKSGELKDKASVIAALGQHTAPLADTLEATFGKYSTPAGAISDPAGLADVFAQVAAAVGSN